MIGDTYYEIESKFSRWVGFVLFGLLSRGSNREDKARHLR